MLSYQIKKTLTNTFIVVILFLITIDALPETSLVHRRLKEFVDPLLDKVGIWQGTWQLFAPDVDKTNHHFYAEITFSDQSTGVWYSPDWSKMSLIERSLKFRQMEYYDSIYYMTNNQKIWKGLAEHLSKTIIPYHDPKAKPIKIILFREWTQTSPPNQQNLLLLERDFNNRDKLYIWESFE